MSNVALTVGSRVCFVVDCIRRQGDLTALSEDGKWAFITLNNRSTGYTDVTVKITRSIVRPLPMRTAK